VARGSRRSGRRTSARKPHWEFRVAAD